MAERVLKVLVVDDSAVVRQAMTTLLARSPQIRTQTAADPIFAMHKMERCRPDVIVLDVEMPRMDGLTFLKHLMATDPIPVVVCSGFGGASARASLSALSAGAVDVITKPVLGVRDFLASSADEILDTVRAASRARVRRLGKSPAAERFRATVRAAPERPRSTAHRHVVAIGASTGGTQAIRAILEAMPNGCEGIVVVQHMPEHFTAAFAEQLDRTCRIEIREARHGDVVRPGLALIAPGDHHLSLRRTPTDEIAVVVNRGEKVERHRPSVNVLFRSVAAVAGRNAVGVLLTGMGSDGADGLLEMRRAGAATLAQDEASSVVFGMPKEAIDLDAVDEVVPLGSMAQAILRHCGSLPDRQEG